jgi:hypothetical protein
MENNWKQKSLETLEKEVWRQFDSDSRLVRRTKELRKIQLSSFTIEDLRLMIGQRFSLDYLVPLALETLNEDLFAEGDLYKGDLLNSVLSIGTEFWDKNKNYWTELNELIKDKRMEIAEKRIDCDKFDECKHRK